MNFSSPFFVKLRAVTRRLGLNRLAASVLFRGDYEDRFGPRLLDEIRASDTVWDVGANVGLYTSQFAQRAGDDGRVVAFEPVPACFSALEKVAIERRIIHPVNAALGAEDGYLTMALEPDALAATHRVVEETGERGDGAFAQVPVRSGEGYAAQHPDFFPNVIKIDVEGFEGEVFQGLRALLDDKRLRCIGIEMHFGLLQQRGESDTPRKLEDELKEHGFRLEWTDPSHLLALR
ncbi:FkbM family methyltransferase [Wenzhouxiangella sediminis]|uniref:FkbM family methyltransferase n=1 Tax=Wenzhouxiangella sediminis TaxID=1792836 RepID=UPI0015F27960|nr:FkbM family methyltransferase [Wenzhouxiangella sediminis]